MTAAAAPARARRALGPMLIGLAAMLWATDALFRFPVTQTIPARFIVLFEHLLALIPLIPVLLFHPKALAGGPRLPRTPRQWAEIALIGAGGSAAATVLFTGSFSFVNPSVAILLQKIQPVLVVWFAFIFLGERPARRFYPWAALALAAAAVLSVPRFQFAGVGAFYSRGAAMALSAAVLWAIATVAGRALVRDLPTLTVTFWRYAFGLLSLLAYDVVAAAAGEVPWHVLADPMMLRSLGYMALFPGLLAMVAYYAGLTVTPASVATFVELLFPVAAVLINTVALHLPLTAIQLGAGAALVVAVARLSR